MKYVLTTAHKQLLVFLAGGMLCVFFFLTRCMPVLSSADESEITAPRVAVLSPSTGQASVENPLATIDVSNAGEGYVMCKYTGSVGKIKVQITKSGGVDYNYDLNANGKYEVFPLTCGNGAYTIGVYENVYGDQYAVACKTTVDVSLRSSFLPFLYPNQIVNFTESSAAVQKGKNLSAGARNDLAIVREVYNYVVANISYDYQKASSVQSGYLPEVDSILSSGKGICYDYAVLTAAMLRSQGIPTQVRVGYVSGGAYHAWISVYISEIGWVNDMIYFDGVSWKLMDPTFAANNDQSEEIMSFIGNGSNYSTLYTY